MASEMKRSFRNYLRYAKVRHYLEIINFAQKKLAREVQQTAGISLRECKFLLQVHLTPGSSLTTIQKLQFLPSSTAAWLAERLVQKNLLVRKQNPKNRREVVLDLSEEGLNSVEGIYRSFFPTDVEDRLASVPESTVTEIEKGLRTQCRL
jgi:DNA-binding MarR family transcriptional regulator